MIINSILEYTYYERTDESGKLKRIDMREMPDSDRRDAAALVEERLRKYLNIPGANVTTPEYGAIYDGIPESFYTWMNKDLGSPNSLVAFVQSPKMTENAVAKPFPDEFLQNYIGKLLLAEKVDDITIGAFRLQYPSKSTLDYLQSNLVPPEKSLDSYPISKLSQEQINSYLAELMSAPSRVFENQRAKMTVDDLPKALKGHEVRYFGKIPVYITTLPAGTLLFRGVPTIERLYDDLLGYSPSPSSPRTLENTYNVFFYPFPMVDKAVLELGKSYKTVIIHVLQRDVKIASMISPSPYSRRVRQSNTFVTTCKYPKVYDPCFTQHFIKENPDVVGAIAIAFADARFQRGLTPDDRKYVSFYSDVRPEFGGVPEIILYPRDSRSNTSTFDSTSLSDIVTSIPELTFVPYHIMEIRSEHQLATILDTGLAGGSMKELIGFDDELYIDKTTGFYISKKHYSGDEANLIKNRSDLSNADLKFVLSTVVGTKDLIDPDSAYTFLKIAKAKAGYKRTTRHGRQTRRNTKKR